MLDHQSSQTLQRSMCAMSKTTNTQSYKSYVTSAYWAQFKVHNRNMKKRGKSCQTSKKTCNNKSCRATWAVFYILMGFVARYSLRYFNQYETKCISANLLAFCLEYQNITCMDRLLRCASVVLYLESSHRHCLVFANVQNFVEHSRKPQLCI